MQETRLISEMEYLRFKENLRRTIIMILVGFVIGMVLGITSKEGLVAAIMLGILFAGVPYAWSVIPVWVFGWAAIIVKLFIAIFLGWIVTPIALIYNIVQMKRYEKVIQQHAVMEQQIRNEDIERENANVDKIVEAINNK